MYSQIIRRTEGNSLTKLFCTVTNIAGLRAQWAPNFCMVTNICDRTLSGHNFCTVTNICDRTLCGHKYVWLEIVLIMNCLNTKSPITNILTPKRRGAARKKIKGWPEAKPLTRPQSGGRRPKRGGLEAEADEPTFYFFFSRRASEKENLFFEALATKCDTF